MQLNDLDGMILSLRYLEIFVSDEMIIITMELLRDAFKKKNFIWREKFLTCFTPSPPTKVGNKTLGNFLVVLDPLPPLQK